MKCPYILTEVQATHQMPVRYKRLDVENYDGVKDTLHLTANDSICTITETLSDCLKEECAAWQDNHCVRTA